MAAIRLLVVGLFGARGENPEEIPSLPGPHFRNR
jgi:hypothetical protein